MRFPKSSGLPERSDRAMHLFAALSLAQILWHLYAAVESTDPRLLLPHLVAWLQDLLLLSLVLGAAKGIGLLLPRNLKQAWHLIELLLLLATGVSLALYPQMLREYLAFPVNLFAGGSGSAWVLLSQYLGSSRLLPAAVSCIVGLTAIFMPSMIELPTWCRRISFAFWGCLLFIGVLTLPRSPHPVVNSLRDEVGSRMFHSQRQVPSLVPSPHGSGATSGLGDATVAIDGPLRYEHVYLIVLEGVSAEQFENGMMGRGSFYRRVAHQAHYYNRYHTTNLDSYTSLIAMLTSVQVPYRSYTDTWIYDRVNQASNLVRALRQRGFYSLFVSTYEVQPFIPVRSDWSEIKHRGDLPSGGSWISIESSRMESATEDRAALSTLAELGRRRQRTFALHELAYGHTTAWRAKTGITQLQYYDRYLNDLYDLLVSEGIWSNSLMVIVSDHGNRSDDSNPSNYRVPLLMVGTGEVAGQDGVLRSHLDLPNLLSSSLTGAAKPQGRTTVTTVGSTARWVYGTIAASGDYLFVDDRTGNVTSVHGSVAPRPLHRSFQAYLHWFASRFGPS